MGFSIGYKIKTTAYDFAFALLWIAIFAIVDGMISGGISYLLWTYQFIYAQLTMDLYRVFFAIVVIATVLLFYLYEKKIGISMLLLLLGYAEDTLYFLALRITKFFTLALTNGRVNVEPYFPAYISGYLGWIARYFGSQLAIPVKSVYSMNILALAVV